MKYLNLPLRISRPVPRYIVGLGIQRQFRYKKETTNGVAAGTSAGQILRRVTNGITLQKDTFTSNEKTSHQQDVDFRHGFRKPAGTLNCELSPGTYSDFHDSIMRRARTVVAAITAMTLTIAASGSEWTVTATAGASFLTSGVKKGMVVRITAGAVNAANLNKNFVVRLVTATVLTVRVLNGSALVAEGPIATCTVSIPGKISFMPSSGFTDESYSLEDWHPNLASPKSELYTGCKLNSAKVTAPSSGIATIDWDVLGLDIVRANAAYYTAPAVETTNGLVASNTGMMYVGDVYYADITNMDFTAMGNMSSAPVVGANVAPQIFFDKFTATGNLSAFFEDGVMRDAFVDETAVGVVCVLAVDNSAASDFVSYVFPKCKLNGAGRDDPNTGITQSIPFKALYNAAGGAGLDTEKTTMMYQDSLG